jgi:hypothetical protein
MVELKKKSLKSFAISSFALKYLKIIFKNTEFIIGAKNKVNKSVKSILQCRERFRKSVIDCYML